MADRNTYITDSNGVDKLYPYTWASNVFRENDPSNTVEASLTALEAQRFAIEIPLQASSWTGDAAPYQYRVNLTDMTDTQMPDMFLVAAGEDFTQDELDTYELLDNPQTYNGYIIIPTKAGAAKPSKDITVRMEGLTVPGDTSAAGVAALQGEVSIVSSLLSVPEMHRMIFRGKNLGESVTEAQIAAIKAGTFDDIYLGDYWQKDGVTWRVVDIDYFYNTGDTALTTHHLVIMPDEPLYNAQMNATNTTDGGYVGSQMYTQNLEQAKTQISGMFGALVLTHRECLIYAVTDGYPSSVAWLDSTLELPSEIMMYGNFVFTPAGDGKIMVNRLTTGKTQFALFTVVPKMIFNRATFWLRDVVSSAYFADVASSGHVSYGNASDSVGVRPYFLIGQL